MVGEESRQVRGVRQRARGVQLIGNRLGRAVELHHELRQALVLVAAELGVKHGAADQFAGAHLEHDEGVERVAARVADEVAHLWIEVDDPLLRFDVLYRLQRVAVDRRLLEP